MCIKCTHLHTFAVATYLRRVAGEAANHILNGLRQVAALLPHADQEIVKLLTPAEPREVNQPSACKRSSQAEAFLEPSEYVMEGEKKDPQRMWQGRQINSSDQSRC